MFTLSTAESDDNDQFLESTNIYSILTSKSSKKSNHLPSFF